MIRSLPSRRVARAVTAVAAAAGLGFGAYTVGTATGADTTVFPNPVATTTTAPADTPLTLDEAVAVALRTAPPGQVGVVTEDREPTGLRYDVTVQHDDGTSTDVEVDTVTGQVTDLDHDDDRD